MRKNSLLTLVLLLFSVPLPAREVPPGYREVARQENVPAEALYSLALTESSWTLPAHHPQAGEIHPWPWTLNVAGKGYRYPTRQAAWQALQSFLQTTSPRRIDVGIAQVNGAGTGITSVPPGRPLILIPICMWPPASCAAVMRRHRVVGSVPPAVITIRRAVSPQYAIKIVSGVSWRH